MMAAVKAKDSKAEVALRSALFRRGLRFRKHTRSIIGVPDIAFTGARLVVFVDSDYWHGRALQDEGEAAFRGTMRTARVDWWVAKLKRNIERDHEVTAALTRDGWTVIRVWESDVLRDAAAAADEVERVVRSRP